MYRPGWFPEYSPQDQKVFDLFHDTLRKHFEQRNYTHIHTPAVEPVDILSRGWDVFDKQVYGLYGLAQGTEDTKDYALHFDLTIPFARYTLDHLNEITFPFKRYQAQPVWRGERHKRGRYKEFWQFDIDTIWRSSQEVGVWYDAESIIVMMKALEDVFSTLKIEKKVIAKISHIRLIQGLVQKRLLSWEESKELFKILDDRYKRTDEMNKKMLDALLSWEKSQFIQDIIANNDLSVLSDCDGYEQMKEIGEYLNTMWIEREFALPIVRGHSYYTGVVAEFFVADDIELGAIAWGGRYENLTDFIDKKHSFSGVGMSVSNRLMELLLKYGTYDGNDKETYFFLNFDETRTGILSLIKTFISEWKVCEFYPVEAKFGKQLEYANKKWYRYAVILGSDELKKWYYQVKDLIKGEVTEITLDISTDS